MEKKEARRKRGARYFISGYLHSVRRKPVQSRRENFVHDSFKKHSYTILHAFAFYKLYRTNCTKGLILLVNL